MTRSTRFQWGAFAPALGIVTCLAGCSDSTEPGSPSALVFAVQPASFGSGTLISPPISVAVRDGSGNTILDWPEDVILSLEGGSSAAELLGATSSSPLAGLGIFDDLRVEGTGTDFRLTARSGGLTEAVSDPFDVHGVFRATSMSAGEYHACALTNDGTAYCWGRNLEGELGTGDIDDRFLPTPVATDLRFFSITAYGRHTCGLSTDATVYCWGSNQRGELGIGSRENSTIPRLVTLPGPVLTVDGGSRHNCALLEGGEAYCWGDNYGGALGIGVADSLRSTPVMVTGDHEWVEIETGYEQSCGLTEAGVAYCWGPNRYGENGVGERNGDYHAPAPVLGEHRFTDLVAGGGPCHGETCGITVEGTVLCWGKNYQRNVGPSDYISWVEPTPIVGDPGFVDVMVGPAMVCGHTQEGNLYCLGNPTYGMLPSTETPIPLVPELDVASLAMGQTQTCVLTTDAEAFCWGSNNYGQLGSAGASLGWTSPVPVWAPPGG